MSARRTTMLAWGLCVLNLFVLAAAVAVQKISGRANEETFLEQVGLLLAFGTFPAMGALLASRQPRNALGWIFISVGLGVAVGVLSSEYAYYGLVKESAPAAALAAWLEQWLWIPSLGLLLTFGLLLFPTGRPPSKGWRWLAWTAGALLATMAVAGMTEERLEGAGYSVLNPVGIAGFDDIETTLEPVLTALVLCALLCLVSVVIRYRRSHGDERQQLKLVTFTAFLMVIGLFAEDLVSGLSWLFPLFLLAFLSSIGVAVLKYRLYDIDLIINRTLVYGTVTAFLGLCYLGLIVTMQQLFTQRTEDSPLIVAVSTLAVAALFRPARLRIQAAIDRRFNRRKYDAAQTIEVFSARLREDIDIDRLSAHLIEVVEETMEPASVSLWLRPTSGVRRLAARG